MSLPVAAAIYHVLLRLILFNSHHYLIDILRRFRSRCRIHYHLTP